jgi:hypothetical protein
MAAKSGGKQLKLFFNKDHTYTLKTEEGQTVFAGPATKCDHMAGPYLVSKTEAPEAQEDPVMPSGCSGAVAMCTCVCRTPNYFKNPFVSTMIHWSPTPNVLFCVSI